MSGVLDARIALVTGGGTRLGRAISVALAGAGADVAVTYLQSAEGAAGTVAEIGAMGRRSVALECDLRDSASVSAMVGEVRSALGPIDLLVLNAGVFRRTPIEAASEDDWDWLMDTNAKGAFLCARELAGEMRERGGAIILLADVAGLRPWPSYIPYSASKAAVVSLTQGLAMALAPRVRVNAVAPGPVLPPDDFDQVDLQRAVDRTLLKRPGAPADVTQAVLYLATAEYVTGVVLPVDGGRHLA